MTDAAISLPYRLRPEFLSPVEMAFFHVLDEMLKENYCVFPKVALTDLFFVARPNENVHHSNKLLRKNVDFLVLRRDSMKPVLAIELDYPKQTDHRPVDDLLEGAFSAAGLPLLHITVQQTYHLEELLSRINLVILKGPNSTTPLNMHKDYSPICPRCGITMVLRFDKDGPHKGVKYYGCLNFPECTETVAVK
jgi:hypothetical protein